MRRGLILVLVLSLGAPALADEPPPTGFFESSVAAQLAAEEVMLATPTPEKARRWLAHLTEEAHVAGTEQERKVAEYVRDRLEEFGLETEIVRYEVFLNHPKAVSLRLVAPVAEELSLMEDFLEVDKDSAAHGVFPGFHGYGASGTASGQVVYANYGTPEDFKKLEEMDISVAGRIVLARYGSVFRGLKVREAEQRGAAGVVLYSDPADDGYMKGDVYPDGPMRHPSAIQRGSVQFLSIQPGDPSTPGYPSRDGAKRLSRAEMTTVPRIPSLPIGYREAEKILRSLGGERVPDEWQGGLPFSYHVGPGGSAVEMSVEMDEGLKPIFNVFGYVRGARAPERTVILGNHRDAWTHGAVDPNSGTAAWLETARAVAAAVESGWRPARTIVFASWDAEEYGLVGSVEWGEDEAAELAAGNVAYLNLDSAVTGPEFNVGGTPSLREIVRESIARVPEPQKGGTVGEAWEQRLRGEWAKSAPVDLDRPDAEFELHLAQLGSGSDYTVFLDHLGIPSISFGFSGKYGVYHSIYDNFRWMERYGDPGFVYHVAAARFYGTIAMRLAGADVLPLRYGSYARALGDQLDELRRDLVRKRRQAESGGAGDAQAGAVPSADFGPVLSALEELGRAGDELDRALDGIVARGDSSAAAAVEAALVAIERALLSEDGLPGRPWFRNLIYAPGLTTGYAPWPFPELRQAVEEGDAALFERGSRRVVAALAEMSRRLASTAAAAGSPN